jgi:hypothetical protein
VPLDLERQGFFLAPGSAIAVDPDHPRFATGRGKALFETDGQPSEALRRIQHVMAQLSAGLLETDAFIQALLAHRLVEPVDVSLSFDDGKSLSLAGLYTVSLDALAGLQDAAALELLRLDYLRLVYAMIGSLKQVSILAQLRNERLTA